MGSDPAKAEDPQRGLVLLLTHAALAAWCISLVLPGLYFNDKHEAWEGAGVLVAGMLMGWMIHGWAVYANLFFAFAVLVLYGKGRPTVSLVLMWVLVATLPAFAQASMNASSSDVPRLQSWGWGFVVWIAAFAIATIAAVVRAGHLGVRGLRIAGVAGIAVLAAVVAFHGYQWSLANEQERKTILAGGTAFTSRELCGIPLTWPEGPVVAPGVLVQLDIDRSLKDLREGYLHLPELPNYQDNDARWVAYRAPGNLYGIRVRSDPMAAPIVLEARRSEGGAVVRLKDAAAGKVLYEQRLRKVRYSFCPYSSLLGNAGRELTTDTALMRALGYENPPRPLPDPGSLAPEATKERCDIDALSLKGSGLHLWDGRTVDFFPDPDNRVAGYCSARYAAVVNVSKSWTKGEQYAAMWLYDRSTLRPLASFHGKSPCDEAACSSTTAQQSRGLRIADDSAIIDMPAGEVRLARNRH